MSFVNARFGQGTGPLLLDRLSCSGREQTLLSCSHSGIEVTSYYCGHDDDVGVRCQGKRLALKLQFCITLTSCIIQDQTYQYLTFSCSIQFP